MTISSIPAWHRCRGPGRVAAVLLAAGLALTGCSAAQSGGKHATSASASPAAVKPGGTVTMAQPAAFAPDYIMPFESGAYSQTTNAEIANLLWPTLYFFGTGKTGIGFNESLSLAYPPVYSNHDTTVTVTLKHYKWSDGTPVTSRDITFFMNLLKANKPSWAHYIKGHMPDDITSYHVKGKYTVVFNLNRSYNPTWFTDDQLSLIVPMPQHAWDKASANSKVGNYDETTSGAKAVYKFLNDQSLKISAYDTDPLWQVVDGPWKLQDFTTDDSVTLVPNSQFSGKDKAKISKFKFVPFTSDTAEFNALLAGKLTIGYVPLNDLSQLPRVKVNKYSILKSTDEAINYISLNYDSPKTGALVKQLYIRKALNHLMDQQDIVNSLLDKGVGGYPDYGPIPPKPPSAYIDPSQRTNPYPYSISTARKILTDHGWSIPSTGAAMCVRPGTAANECGAGIPQGKRLEFNLVMENGVSWFTGALEAYKSSASKAGVVINLRGVPFNTVVSTICGTSLCDSPGWEMADWGGNGAAWSYGDPYPAGGNVFLGHVGIDYTPTSKFLTLLQKTYTAPASSTVSAMRAYDAYVVSQAPVVWQPVTYTVNAVSSSLKGVAIYASNFIAPQNWYFAG